MPNALKMVQDVKAKAFMGFIFSSHKIIRLIYIITYDRANEVKNESLAMC